MLSEYDAKNPPALMRLVRAGVQLHPFPHDMLVAAHETAFELYDEEAAKNPAFKKIYTEWKKFRDAEIQWFKVAEASYANFLYSDK
jgi:TRAP-type mannitol/chloroaromatic compound transport system substrate-binding protein